MDSNPRAFAKITHPSFPDVLPRKRLFDLLEASRQRPIIWVSGPPGSGKTTLVGHYIEKFNIPSIWYNVDEGDSDPATFFYYMGMAAQKASPKASKSLPLLTPEYLPGIHTFSRRYFEKLCLRFKCPAIIIFDNYHEIPGGADFHAVLQYGLSAIPEGVNVIIISRRKPGAGFMRHKANRMMHAIGWENLKFTLDETEELLRISVKETPSKISIGEIYQRTNGWAAGLVLMLEAAKEQSFECNLLSKMTMQDIFSYFANEIFDKTDESLRAFLIKSAFLPDMSGPMAADLTGRLDAGQILSRLNRIHYFTENRFQNQEKIYRYHPLFRDFLLSKSENTLSRDEISGLRDRSAGLLEKAGQLDAAVSLYCENKNWEEATRLICQQCPLLLKQGRNLHSVKWLTRIPSAIFKPSPWLNYWMGASYCPLDPLRSQSYFANAYNLFKKRNDLQHVFLAWSGMVDAIMLEYEDLKRLDGWLQEFEDQKEAFSRLPSDEIKARATVSMFAARFFRKPEEPYLGQWVERALWVTEKDLDANIQSKYLFNLVHYRTMQGDMVKAASILLKLNRLAEMADTSPLNKIEAKFAMIIYYQGEGFHTECLEAMQEGLKLSKDTGVRVWDVWLLGHGASSAMNSGDDETAAQLLNKMADNVDRMGSWELCAYYYFRAREAMIDGALEKANANIVLSLELEKKLVYPPNGAGRSCSMPK